MAFPKIPINTKNLLVGAGAVSGVPAACYGGYCIYDATTSENKDKSHSLNPSELRMDTTFHDSNSAGNSQIKGITITPAGCFNNFFPSVELKKESLSDTSSSSISDISISEKGESTTPEGCMLARFDDRQDSLVGHFTFTSEITVKNDKFGWAIWTYNDRNGSEEWKTVSNSSGQPDYDYDLWTYWILFLEKEGEQWKINGGYHLSDLKYFSASSWVEITLPGGNGLVNLSGHTSTTYSGIWTTSESGKEIFEEIKFQYGESKQSWLGRSRGSGDLFETSDKDFKLLGYYDINKGWVKTQNPSTSPSVETKLNELYAPFKDKKGNWQTAQSYCSSSSSIKLDGLCTSK